MINPKTSLLFQVCDCASASGRANQMAQHTKSAPRAAVIRAATATSTGVLIGGAAGRFLLPTASLQEYLLLPDTRGSALNSLGLGMALGGCVTLLRSVALSRWHAFAREFHESNTLTLGNAAAVDACVLALLPAVSEEVAFRGFFQPLLLIAVHSHITAALVVSLVFGVLHAGAGRRTAFVAWASFIGLLYAIATVRSCICYMHYLVCRLLQPTSASIVDASSWLLH